MRLTSVFMELKDPWSGIRPDRMKFVSHVPERLHRFSAVPVMELMFRLEIWHAYRSDIRKDITSQLPMYTVV